MRHVRIFQPPSCWDGSEASYRQIAGAPAVASRRSAPGALLCASHRHIPGEENS